MGPFKKKKVSIETLPDYLHDTRNTLELTAEHVSRLTQIPPKHLQSLEHGDYESLPADVYVRGYLKSLASVYEISAEVLLSQFEKERGIDRTVQQDGKKPSSSAELSRPKFALTPRTLTMLAVVLLAVGSVGYLFWQLRSVSAAPNLNLVYPSSDTTVSSRNILLRGETELGSRVYINGQEILVDDLGEFREVVNLTEGTNRLHIVSRNKFGNETSLNRVLVVSGAEKIAGLTASTTDEFADRPIVVSVFIGQEPAWVSINADGKNVHNSTIDAETKLTFAADNELILTTGNAGATRVMYNGQDLGPLGQAGEVISDIRFTP
jgi:hypothetical protein